MHRVFLIIFTSIHFCDCSFSFAHYYGDHMVLQKSPERALLWGYGPEGAEVTVFLSGPVTQKTQPVTVTKGIWQVILNSVEAGGPYNVTASIQDDTVTLTDVLFGDIWLCGGQSNMCFQTSKIFNASEELALADKYPAVRTFKVGFNISQIELMDLTDVDLPWSVPTASHLSNFSAVCWLFGRYMYEKLKYPIGLVQSCVNGTAIEAWSSKRALQQCGLELGAICPICFNSVLWNAMIHPLVNMTLKGVIWYQGEKNAFYHENMYNCSFPAMINDWRMTFHQGSGKQTALDFPFGFVQLSTYMKGSTNEGFPNIRWHQTADIGFVPNCHMQRTFMAVAMDLPDETSPYGTIHPRDKQDVAYRLTLGARAVAYNEMDVPFLGPFPVHILTLKMYVIILYNQIVSVSPSKDIFEICCSKSPDLWQPQCTWVPAPIMEWGPTSILLSVNPCPASEVAALRYAWKDWPCDFKACPVYSASGILPAPPFISNRDTDKGIIWKNM